MGLLVNLDRLKKRISTGHQKLPTLSHEELNQKDLLCGLQGSRSNDMPLGTRMSSQILVFHTILQGKEPGILREMVSFTTRGKRSLEHRVVQK